MSSIDGNCDVALGAGFNVSAGTSGIDGFLLHFGGNDGGLLVDHHCLLVFWEWERGGWGFFYSLEAENVWLRHIENDFVLTNFFSRANTYK